MTMTNAELKAIKDKALKDYAPQFGRDVVLPLLANIERLKVEQEKEGRTCGQIEAAMKWAGIGGLMRLKVLTRLSMINPPSDPTDESGLKGSNLAKAEKAVIEAAVETCDCRVSWESERHEGNCHVKIALDALAQARREESNGK